jgi:hypothetical protein
MILQKEHPERPKFKENRGTTQSRQESTEDHLAMANRQPSTEDHLSRIIQQLSTEDYLLRHESRYSFKEDEGAKCSRRLSRPGPRAKTHTQSKEDRIVTSYRTLTTERRELDAALHWITENQ